MEIINVYPKDVYVAIEFSIDEIKKFVKTLDIARIDFDGNNVEEREAVSFVVDKMYPNFKMIIEETEKKNGS